MKRKLKWISLNYVLPSYGIFDILKIGVGKHNWMYVRKKDFHVSCTWYKSLNRSFVMCILNPNWHEGWYFYILVLFGSYFVSCFVFKDFQTLLEVKMYSNRVDLKSCWANWVFKKLNLGGANDEHFSCFQSSWGFILCTVRPRDTQPQDARTLQMHVFVMGPKIFEMNKFM